MAGTNEPDQQEEGVQHNDCNFQWDENSQLYYHSSSGFYHDPNAGWYYSSRDGVYYKFENGNYVILETENGDQAQVYEYGGTFVGNSLQNDSSICEPCDKEVDCPPLKGDASVSYEAETVPNGPSTADTECRNSELLEILPPPSEWLEETLIDLYLSGYSNQAMNAASDGRMMPLETEDRENINFSIDGAKNGITPELEEGDWISNDSNDAVNAIGSALDEGAYQDEEIWRSQYGQVIKSDEDLATAFPVVDLWDWKRVAGTRKEGKSQGSRLVGNLVRRSVKLHPSMPSTGGVLKTAPICEVHLDLVRVTSGQVYKLRSPSVGYLSSLTSYDSSNPTKDWGFPKFSIDGLLQELPRSCKNPELKIMEGTAVHRVMSSKQLHVSPKNTGHAYRDRAAERRALHGSYGVAPGEKKDKADLDSAPSSPVNACPEEAATESLNMSFGAGSFAKRIMESMGWKEGEALGSSVKGLTEPLRAVGNRGNAGLGWDHTRKLF